MARGREWPFMVMGGVLVAVIGWALFIRDPLPSHTVLNQQLVDSLNADNARLARELVTLSTVNTRLLEEQARMQRSRDSLVVVSNEATTRLRQMRASLPAAPTVPDSALRGLYQMATATLDSALAELARKDRIISTDNRLRVHADSLRAVAEARLVKVQTQYTNEQAESAELQTKYDALVAAQPRCGRKCGIVIGVASAVVTAFAVRQVQLALLPSP